MLSTAKVIQFVAKAMLLTKNGLLHNDKEEKNLNCSLSLSFFLPVTEKTLKRQTVALFLFFEQRH